MKVFAALFAVVAAVSACQTGAFMEVVSTDIVDRTYTRSAVRGTLSGNRIESAAKVREHQGKVMVCVAVAGEGKGTFGPEWPDAVAKALLIDLDGERLITGANFAKTYVKENTSMGKTAQCAVTDRPWRPAYGSMRLEIDYLQIRLTA